MGGVGGAAAPHLVISVINALCLRGGGGGRARERRGRAAGRRFQAAGLQQRVPRRAAEGAARRAQHGVGLDAAGCSPWLPSVRRGCLPTTTQAAGLLGVARAL